MTITLIIEGKERTFVNDFVSARMLRRTIAIAKSVHFEDITVDELDTLVQYLVELYGNQFTVDDVYDGISSADLIPVLSSSIQDVVHGMADATAGEGKNE